MNERAATRQSQLLTQQESAGRAGVSLATWRRWEEDPAAVSAKTRAACEKVLNQDSAMSVALSEAAADFENSWSDCHYLTPRQAYAIASVLLLWADGELQEWGRGADNEPLHDVPPFAYFDRRVLFYVNESRAWVESVRERCYAIAAEIQRGTLPFDRDGAYIDELLIAASLAEAESQLNDMPELYDELAPREAFETNDDYKVGDNDWESVSDAFDDRCRWDEWEVPIFANHPLLPLVLAARHPYTWFDLVPPSGRGYLQRLGGLTAESESVE
jgi:transcriptional regulator with XRE-family HTH domain